MAEKYTREQFWKLYQRLPQKLKDTLFAEETGNSIYEICKRNKIERNLGQIVDYVGQVLLGILPPSDFQETLEKELKLEKEVAKRVAQEVNRFIFYPVKSSLEELYKTPIAPQPTTLPKTTPERKPATFPTRDIYREPIE